MVGTYELYYWPSIPGRGEFPRLVLEEAAAAYRDVGREDGFPAILEVRNQKTPRHFAPPILVDGEIWVSQTALICQYVGEKHGLAPASPQDRWTARNVMLTLTDMLTEVHDVHHPVSTSLTYEEQAEVAVRAAQAFADHRLRRFLEYFVDVGAPYAGPWMFGPELTYVDLAISQLLRGLDYAFPRAMRALQDEPALQALRELQRTIDKRPRILAYRASERCLDFNEHGIFRYYPALDVELTPNPAST